MAKVTIVFEDCDDGISVSLLSDPPLPHRDDFSSKDPDLTDAQHMALGVIHHMESNANGDENDAGQEKPKGKCCRKPSSDGKKCCDH